MTHEHDIDRPCVACGDYGLRPGNAPDDIAEPCRECPTGERIAHRLASALAANTSRIPRDHEPATTRTPHTTPLVAGSTTPGAAA